MSTISKYICVLLLSSTAIGAKATEGLEADSLRMRESQGIQFADKDKDRLMRLAANRKIPTFAGLSVSADLAGAFLAATRGIGNYEAALRLNLKNTFFPVVELGWGVCDQIGDATQLHYKVHAPYGRVGLDYNVKKDKNSLNRVFVGFRYGYSNFNYDLFSDGLYDAHWKTTVPFHYTDQSGSAHWGEAVFGLQTSLWKFVHLGWSLRYRLRIAEHQTEIGRAWYIPGLGRNIGGSNFAGTFQLVFDLTRFQKYKR